MGHILCPRTTHRHEETIMTLAPSAIPADWHRRQRDLVAASLIAVPGVKRPTHRRWA
jgi:hypothetical protein